MSLYASEAAPGAADPGPTRENLHVRADSSTFPVEIHTVGLEAAGKIFFLSVIRDSSERKRAEATQEAWKRSAEANQQTNRLLQQLSADLLRSQDYLKRKIARELHDSTAHLLAALSINLGLLRDADLEPSQRSKLLSETIDVANHCSLEVRTISYLLHPPLLDDLGLRGALQTYAQGFHQHTGIALELTIPPDFGRLDQALEMTIFRIVQEGLSNIHRHSGSALAEIRLERDSRAVRLDLLDHGRGLPATSTPHQKESFRLRRRHPGDAAAGRAARGNPGDHVHRRWNQADYNPALANRTTIRHSTIPGLAGRPTGAGKPGIEPSEPPGPVPQVGKAVFSGIEPTRGSARGLRTSTRT